MRIGLEGLKIIMRKATSVVVLVPLLLLAAAHVGHADEGMWLFNDFPSERVQSKYDFDVTQDLLDRIRLASTRLYPYGSGSFVSPHGLVFTNHHVASDCIHKLTTAEHNYMRDGFHAAAFEDEKACPDLEINVLVRIQDVTEKVKGVVAEDTALAEANQLKKAEMTRIEGECTAAGGDRCDAVSLFAGGQYHLYEYKKYTDIRLVFAPEEEIAAFGGDPDNFNYPRYCLDFTFLRVYEDGKPAATSNYLRWSPTGVQDGELTFISGHPGSTGRLLTYAALEFSRDTSYPLVLRRIEDLEKVVGAFSAASADNKRIARDNLLGQQNSRKAFRGFLRGLRDEDLMARKLAEETELRAAVDADSALKEQFGSIWDEAAAAYSEYAEFYRRYYLLERSPGRGSRLLEIARDVVRYAEERSKPNDKRLREFVDSNLPSQEQSLYSPAPIYLPMEQVTLAEYLRFLKAELGADDPVVQAVLSGQSPAVAAKGYLGSTKLADPAERKRLATGTDIVKESDDGMIKLALILDGPARELRSRYEDNVQAALNSSAGKIAQARFAVDGAGDYPDATFTLRLSYAPVKGYEDGRGKWIPYATTIGGVYERATGSEPYKLPESWLRAKEDLDPETPFDFVTTADSHGGNSGSPTINAKGEVIGILFDGNIESLPNRFVYTDQQSRSVHVASQVIVEALRKIYKADRLLEELGIE